MIIENIIKKKINKEELKYDEIDYIINGFINERISEEEMTTFLQCICKYSMTDDEIYYMTDVMVKSGNILDLSNVKGIKVDKHSTGGVGDKTTLVIGPILACNDVIFPKMSGKSLGHTGGTIDKLLSIPGFNVNLNQKELIDSLNKVGMCVISQSDDIVPADKKIYSLRDKTNTTMSIPLIASSIMSKKIACSSDKILIDVKVGKGALVKHINEAIELAKVLCKIGKRYNREIICIITNMDNPLGNMVGNSLEIKEVIEILNNRGNRKLRELCIYLSSYLLSIAKRIDINVAKELVTQSIVSGRAYNKFLEFINNQGGNISGLTYSNNVIEVKSNKEGYITSIDAFYVGNIVNKMAKKEIYDYSIGVEFIKHVGSYVYVGEVIAKVYANELYSNDLINAFTIEETKKEEKLIKYIIKY